MIPTYIMICCNAGCLAKEARDLTMRTLQSDPGAIYRNSERTLHARQCITRFFTAEQINREPQRLYGQEIVGWGTCNHGVRIEREVSELLSSRIRVRETPQESLTSPPKPTTLTP